jgi:hypothetical protein
MENETQYFYRAYIHSTTEEPIAKKVKILKWISIEGNGNGVTLVLVYNTYQSGDNDPENYQIQVRSKELFNSPEEAKKSLKAEYQSKILAKVQDLAFLQSRLDNL